MVNLYTLDKRMRALMDRIQDEADQDTGAIPEELWAELDELTRQEGAALADLACAVKEQRADADAVRAEARRLAERARALDARVDRLTAVLEQRVGPDGLRDPRVTARWYTRPTIGLLVPAEQLPAEYQRVKVEPDKLALKQVLMNGGEVPGAALGQSRGLTIR